MTSISFSHSGQTYTAHITPLQVLCMGTLASVEIFDAIGKAVASCDESYVMKGQTLQHLESLVGQG